MNYLPKIRQPLQQETARNILSYPSQTRLGLACHQPTHVRRFPHIEAVSNTPHFNRSLMTGCNRHTKRPTSSSPQLGFSRQQHIGERRSCRCCVAHNHRTFCTNSNKNSTKKLLDILSLEVQHEESSQTKSPVVVDFLKKTKWQLTDTPGDINIRLTQTVMGKEVTIEFPGMNFDSANPIEDPSSPQGAHVPQSSTTDFTVTVKKQGADAGVTFYCSTIGPGDAESEPKTSSSSTPEELPTRFLIGSVRVFANEAERESSCGYGGPEFDDLDQELQSSLDEWLEDLGIDGEVCDAIDGMAEEKEQREYMRWLKLLPSVVRVDD